MNLSPFWLNLAAEKVCKKLSLIRHLKLTREVFVCEGMVLSWTDNLSRVYLSLMSFGSKGPLLSLIHILAHG